MILFVYMFAQREYDLYFYVKRDCLLFSVNVKLFYFYQLLFYRLLLRESVFIRGIGDPLERIEHFLCNDTIVNPDSLCVTRDITQVNIENI